MNDGFYHVARSFRDPTGLLDLLLDKVRFSFRADTLTSGPCTSYNQVPVFVFAAVFVFPELDDDVDVDIDWEKDVREDRFHASGAGGQHVNKTESAIRLTHLETGIVVSCQSERSQHKNRATARKILGARLYDLRLKQQQEAHAKIGSEKLKIEWGSQIRSYVVHPYRLVKDHRTDVEHGNPDAVFDGDLTKFMEAFLLAQEAK